MELFLVSGDTLDPDELVTPTAESVARGLANLVEFDAGLASNAGSEGLFAGPGDTFPAGAEPVEGNGGQTFVLQTHDRAYFEVTVTRLVERGDDDATSL